MVWNELKMEGAFKKGENFFNQMLLYINKRMENRGVNFIQWNNWYCHKLKHFKEIKRINIKLWVCNSSSFVNFYEFFAYKSFYFELKYNVEKVFCLQTFAFSFLIFYAKNYTFCVMVSELTWHALWQPLDSKYKVR